LPMVIRWPEPLIMRLLKNLVAAFNLLKLPCAASDGSYSAAGSGRRHDKPK
jgi:hypothetical protein